MTIWLAFVIGVFAGVIGTIGAFVVMELVDFFRSQAR